MLRGMDTEDAWFDGFEQRDPGPQSKRALAQDLRRACYHWFLFIQPYPLPEMLIGVCARDYLHGRRALHPRGVAGPDGDRILKFFSGRVDLERR